MESLSGYLLLMMLPRHFFSRLGTFNIPFQGLKLAHK